MMQRWQQKCKVWKSQRRQRWLQKWAYERVQGKTRFVLRTALLITMTNLTVYELFQGHVGLETIFVCHCTGLVVALFLWRDNETRYRNALVASGINQPQINAN
jgi:metal-dependent hydrolase (beta-lactamase superfamily II)